jgi:DNA polymerase III epsilon subunit-like protein
MIPELISEITSISDEDVKDAPKIDDLKQQIIDFV